MEGLPRLPDPQKRPRVVVATEPSPWWAYLPAAGVAGISYAIHYLPVPPFRVVSGSGSRYPVSAAIIAILIGALVRNVLPLPKATIQVAKQQARRIIPITIVLTGAGLNLLRAASIGTNALLITVACMAVATVATIWLARIAKLGRRAGLLIGAGTAICGTSAIVAVAPLIEAEDQDLMLSIGTINILGLVLMFVLPVLGGLMHLKDDAFGVWAGTTIHAVPQVVAAGFAYSAQAGALATLVKLVRVTLLAPFLFIVGLSYSRQRGTAMALNYRSLVPAFLYGFVALSLCNTFGLFPVLQFRFGSFPLQDVLTNLGELLLTLSMAAMGMEVNIRFLAHTGGSAVATGTAATVILGLTSLLLIRLLL